MTSRACEHHVSWADIVETSARVQHGTIWATSCRPHIGIDLMWILRSPRITDAPAVGGSRMDNQGSCMASINLTALDCRIFHVRSWGSDCKRYMDAGTILAQKPP